ncbi:hypothetical protein EMIT0P265_70023 [Pseudomonas zeae]
MVLTKPEHCGSELAREGDLEIDTGLKPKTQVVSEVRTLAVKIWSNK